MKKLIKIIVSAFFVCFSILSCQKDNIDSQQIQTSNVNDLHVTSDVALEVSNNYFEISNTTSKSNSSRIGRDGKGLIDMKDKKVKSLKTFKDEKTQEELFHLFRYEGGGFSIISADKRMTPVLAFSESNDFENEELAGIKEWIMATKMGIKKVKKDLKEPEEKDKRLWEIFLKQSKGGRVAVTCQPDQIFDTGRFVDAVAIWGQGGEYKFYSPTDNGCQCQKKPAGCASVAMAMIMRYHQHPQTTMSFNGASFVTNYPTMARILSGSSCALPSPESLQVAMLMRLCGGAANSGYGVFGSCNTYTYPWNVDDGLSFMGFSNGGNSGSLSDQYNNLKSDLMNGFPVIFSGTQGMFNLNDWHIWVGDGYRSYRYEYAYTDPRTEITRCISNKTEWIGMNWGWDGECNGYFYAAYEFDTSQNGTNYGTYRSYLNVILHLG